MTKTALHFILLTLLLILAQAIVFDNICLFNVAVPMVFVYIIFKLPLTINRNLLLGLSFLLGLTIDIFADTYGMNALACTVTAMCRPAVLSFFLPRGEEPADTVPSFRSLSTSVYVKYMAVMNLLYCSLIFIIQAFSFFNFALTVMRIVSSTVLSLLLMLAIDCLTTRRHEKRL